MSLRSDAIYLLRRDARDAARVPDFEMRHAARYRRRHAFFDARGVRQRDAPRWQHFYYVTR